MKAIKKLKRKNILAFVSDLKKGFLIPFVAEQNFFYLGLQNDKDSHFLEIVEC